MLKSYGPWLLAALILIFGLPVMAQAASPPTVARNYLPGDFVHIIVQAPSDTAQITATLPDGTVISLVQERRTNAWRGIWQVPLDFKKGEYTVKLSSIDVGGNVFDGETDSFNIGELAMITLVGKPTAEAAPKAPLREQIKQEGEAAALAKAKAAGEEDLLRKLTRIVSQPTTELPPQLSGAGRAEIIRLNLRAGRERFDQGRYAEAAAYFRVVLYLDPRNQEAGAFLAQAEAKRQEQARQEKWRLGGISILAVLAIALLGAFIFLGARRLNWAAPGARLSLKEKQKAFFEKMGWTGDPFARDAIKQLFAGDNALQPDGFRSFLRSRIEEVGGEGIAPLTEAALDEIYRLSKGKPQEALEICAWSLEKAVFGGEELISAELVKGYERIALCNILIADDDEIVRASLEAILKKGGGYQTDQAVDGEEALRKIKKNVYGLVLLDIEMPKLNGYEILKQARALYPNLPIIFVTGKGTAEKTMQSFSHLNLTGYIEKPFTPEKVLDVVGRTLKS